MWKSLSFKQGHWITAFAFEKLLHLLLNRLQHLLLKGLVYMSHDLVLHCLLLKWLLWSALLLEWDQFL